MSTLISFWWKFAAECRKIAASCVPTFFTNDITSSEWLWCQHTIIDKQQTSTPDIIHATQQTAQSKHATNTSNSTASPTGWLIYSTGQHKWISEATYYTKLRTWLRRFLLQMARKWNKFCILQRLKPTRGLNKCVEIANSWHVFKVLVCS